MRDVRELMPQRVVAPSEPQLTHRAPESLVGAKARFRPGRQSTTPGMAWNGPDLLHRKGGIDRQMVHAVRAIRDLDPATSQAVWNFIRLLNPGCDLKAVRLTASGDTQEVGGEAQQRIDQLATLVGAEYGGGLDQFIDVLALNLLTTGAVCAEVAPMPSLDDVQDWYPIDPLLMAFRRQPQPDGRGPVELGQYDETGGFKPMPPAQVFYQPLDPDVDDPYGRGPMQSAVREVVFLQGVIDDVRAAAHNTGYPKIHVGVVWDAISKRAPESLTVAGKEAELDAWATKMLNAIAHSFESMEVDDTIIHYDYAVPEVINGFLGGSFDFKSLIDILTARLDSALKQLPIMTGHANAASHGSVEWNIASLGIGALRRPVKRMVEKLANASLRLWGLPFVSRLSFDDLRTTDRLYESQAERLEGQSLEQDVRMGWRTNDEAAEIRTGHKAVGDAQLTGITPAATGGPGMPTGKDNPGETQGDNLASNSAGNWSAAWDEETLRGYALLAAESLRAPDVNTRVDKYVTAGGVLFMQAKAVVLELLQANGLVSEQPATRYTGVEAEIADAAFGLRYRREMKGLLRSAVREGIKELSGLDADVSEALIERIWRQNTVYIDRIRGDFLDAIEKWTTMDDAAAWFRENAYRQEMMGSFLGKQGLEGGYAYGVDQQRPGALFVWELGAARHCPDCDARAGETYTYGELLSIGLPGSASLQCMSRCRCSVFEVSQ